MTTKTTTIMKTTSLKYNVIVTILSAFLVLTFTQCKTSRQVQNTGETQLENALLWRISGNGLEHPSWLYGTIHMIPSEQFFLPAGTEAAFDSSSALYLEVDMTELEDPARQMQLLQDSYMKDDLTLKDLVTEEEYEMIKVHFAELGLPLMFLQRIKPMFLSVFADGSISPNSLQDGSIKVYEMELTEMAKENDIPIGGLETLDFQMSIMDSIPYEAQADMLMESIKMADQAGSQYDSLFALYISQDINSMYSSIDEDQNLSSFDSLLLIQRNHNWIPVMREKMMENSSFFAVGAAHLGGPDGVIALLRKEGYRVVAVK
jgi:uncharacterized protein YbaP (TraB family)